jgi:hypothetical protein
MIAVYAIAGLLSRGTPGAEFHPNCPLVSRRVKEQGGKNGGRKLRVTTTLRRPEHRYAWKHKGNHTKNDSQHAPPIGTCSSCGANSPHLRAIFHPRFF